jgi:hypothetical protein
MSNISSIISTNHLIQAVIFGGVFAFLSAIVIINAKIKVITTTVNGWRSSLLCGRPGSGILLRAASQKFLPMVNVAEEAVYWMTSADSTGKKLNGQHDYILHFPAGGLPPNEAFWSLTMTDLAGYMVSNLIDRSSVGDRSGLVPNKDGSTDIYIQRAVPVGHETNWLPAPSGNFKLMLRAYLPGSTVLDGTYRVPLVQKVG